MRKKGIIKINFLFAEKENVKCGGISMKKGRNIIGRLGYGLLGLMAVISLAGCGKATAREPVTVTIWHVYGGQAESPLNDMIAEFNETVGKEENIQVQVGSVTNTNTIHENVLSSAFGDPGAEDLPDMFVSYPKTVLALPDETALVDYQDYFSEEELSSFIPAFLTEGQIDGRQLILPVAKSTEIMFVNETAFNRYAKASGASLSDLETWEGVFRMAEDYTRWTDEQTPDIPEDGKPFFVHDYHFNYFQVGVESLGEHFFTKDGTELVFGPAFERVWTPYAQAAVEGGIWLQSGYATEPLRTGDSIVSVASSASVLYYSDTVTYADNTTEKVNMISMPCPVFENGEKLVMQRGAGICTVKSTPEREKACITFLRWLTDPERNVEFVTQLGYMPVKQESFEKYLPAAIDRLQDPMYQSLYQAFLQTQEQYIFYTAPQYDSYLDLETRFEDRVRQKLQIARRSFLESPEQSPEELAETTLESFRKDYQQ